MSWLRLRRVVDKGANGRQRSSNVGSLPVLAVGIFAGLVCIIVYSLQGRSLADLFSIASVGIMVAGASLLAGGLIGFLFGIPRTLQQRLPSDRQEGVAEGEVQEAPYQANTNLEEISDWLTKILVGVGLTQLTEISQRLNQAADFIAVGLGGFESSSAFALAMLIYFTVCGFFVVYLWTRLYFAGALVKADVGLQGALTESLATLYDVEDKLDRAEKRQVRAVRQKAERLLGSLAPDVRQARGRLEDLAQEYERLHDTMVPGDERTRRMDQVVAQVRALAREVNYICEDGRRYFESGFPGKRIVALGLLQALAYPDCFDLVLKGIGESISAFEQYHALRAAQGMLGSLSREDKGKLAKVLNEQRSEGDGRYITPENVGRWELSERILSEIGSQRGGEQSD